MSGSRDQAAKLVRTAQTIRREIDGWTITHTCTPPSTGSQQAAQRAVRALRRLVDEARVALLILEGEINAADEAETEHVQRRTEFDENGSLLDAKP